MVDERGSAGWSLVLASAALAVGLIVAAALGGGALARIKAPARTITVKGFSERPIVSDHASWSGNLVARTGELASGYDKLEADLARVRRYLQEAGIPNEQVEIAPVAIGLRFRQTDQGMWTPDVEGYDLTQQVTVSAPDVEAVDRVSRGITSLIREGVEINSFPPAFFYNGLDTLKIEMLGAAAADARQRAEALAAEGGAGVGELVSTTQGVFQITPRFSTEISAGGMYDTSSIEKTVRAVVTVAYAID